MTYSVHSTQPAHGSRYHALDSQRAVMMLLGIYLHAVLGYSPEGARDWPYADPHPTAALDVTMGWIHGFRMPAFFLLAGFFGALLWHRHGATAFIRNRCSRIVLPFLVFWPLLYGAVFTLAVRGRVGWGAVGPAWISGQWLTYAQPIHLWFLEYLAIYYAAAAAIAWAARRAPRRIHDHVHRTFRWIVTRSYAPFVCAMLSWIPLATMGGDLALHARWLPSFPLLTAYAIPFLFGWLLYHGRTLLPRFERHTGLYLWCALVGFLVYVAVPRGALPFVRGAGNAVMCWCTTFALTGMFLRETSRPSRIWRYLSDASYWMYLVHVPVVVTFQYTFRDVGWSVFVKVPVVLALTSVVVLVTYDTLVRPTWIGALLNGKRQARGLPLLES